MFKRFGLGVAVGYVLGARAGQKRYEQITDLAERAMDLPLVGRLTEGGRTLAEDHGRRVLSGLRERARWGGESSEDDEGADDEAEGAYDDEDEGAYDEEEDGANDDEDEGAYDDEDEGADDDEEEGAYDDEDEGADDGGEDSAEEDTDDDGEESDDDMDSRGSRSRRAVSSVVSAARERGRVA